MTDFDKTEYAYKNGYTTAKEEIGGLFNIVKAMVDKKDIHYQNKVYTIVSIGIMNSGCYYIVLENIDDAKDYITVDADYIKL